MEESKTCTGCGETKPLSEFHKDKYSRDGLTKYCKTCISTRGKEFQKKRPFYRTVENARRRAKARDLPFSLTEEYLESIWTGVCPVFQTRLNLPSHGEGHTVTVTRPSLDRIRPDMGYVKGNVIWISSTANLIKSNASSADILAVGAWLQQTEEEIKRHEAD